MLRTASTQESTRVNDGPRTSVAVGTTQVHNETASALMTQCVTSIFDLFLISASFPILMTIKQPLREHSYKISVILRKYYLSF